MNRVETEILGVPQKQKEQRQRDHDGPHLTFRQKEVLSLMAQGLSTKEIAEKLSISTGTVRTHKYDIFSFFQATNSVNAVLSALHQGFLDRKEDLKNEAFEQLTESEMKVLDAMTANNGARSSNKEIAESLLVTPNTVGHHFVKIFKKTNLNRMQLAVLYSEKPKTKYADFNSPDSKTEPTPRQMQVLNLIVQGLTDTEIGDHLEISLSTAKVHKKALFKTLGAINSANAVRIAFDMGILKPENSENKDTHESALFRETIIYQRRQN